MITYKILPVKKTEKTETNKKHIGFADNLMQEVLKARYTELEEIKSIINSAKKNSKHKCNVLLLEKFIVEIEREQGITH